MADEIENHLLAKLRNAIEIVEKDAKHRSAKSASQQLKKVLFEPSTSAAPNVPKLTRDKLYNLNNLLAEWQIQSSKPTHYPLESRIFDYKFSRNVNSELQEKQERAPSNGVQTNSQGANRSIAAAASGESTPPSNHEPRLTSETEETRWSTRSVDAEKVHGFDDKVMSLQRLLIPGKDDSAQFKAIAIVGMRGIGKTTLCQLIFEEEAELIFKSEVHFLPRIWVCMSKQRSEDEDNRVETVKRILRCLGVEDGIINSVKRHGLKGLLHALRLQLMGKKYMIVLDDIWNTKDEYQDFFSSVDNNEKCSEKLAYGLPKGYGGAVIVTSRIQELANTMVGEENIHQLLPVSDQSCWNIFMDSFGDDDKQLVKEVESLKGKILEKCSGLPLAAKMMGQIAREQSRVTETERVPERRRDENAQEQSAN